MKLPILTFEQPIGEFALAVMTVNQILEISYIDRREFDSVALDTKGGPQREKSDKRINEIAEYSQTTDATFPTPILLGIPNGSYSIDNNYIELENNKKVASVVDGQHRLLGLEKSSKRDDFVLPVVFVLDANEEQKALIFAIINGKQTRVPASVIYDLFQVVEGRNPFKTAHEIARALNSDEISPFYRRLKMLGKKIKGSNETLSQGTFISQLLKHISTAPDEDFSRARAGLPFVPRPKAVFNNYFIEGKDEVILKILLNLFNAVKNVFTQEWNNPEEYVLSKTTGYTGIMRALPEIIKKGSDQQDLSYDFFLNVFNSLKDLFHHNDERLVNDTFPSGSEGERKLQERILSVL